MTNTPHALRPLWPDRVELLGGPLQLRRDVNRRYLASLRSDNLLQNFYQEAAIWGPTGKPADDIHWGWESPTSQVRGHFLGHWLSASARMYATTRDVELKGKADFIVSELGRCQKENGGEWLGPLPEKYFHWMGKGRKMWAPHYMVHKTLMGLYEMFSLSGNEQALDLAINCAKWFHRWSGEFTTEQFDDILDQETGGMLEVWSDLYGVTKQEEHLDLIHRYDRRRLFDRLLSGEDVLTNRHANTTIPEVQGAARAWEVTGEQRFRDVVEAYWEMAVTNRGYFCTGGQTCFESWTAPFQLSTRLSENNQEHCTVYNMMRLAEYLLRWTGDPTYADYWERNLVNGVMAQQNPQTGMVTYYLSMMPGATKRWGEPTSSFWCCYGTLVQANAQHGDAIFYESDGAIAVMQYQPSRMKSSVDGSQIEVMIESAATPRLAPLTGPPIEVTRPEAEVWRVKVTCDRPTEFDVELRIPWWADGAAVTVDGRSEAAPASRMHKIRRSWSDSLIEVQLPKRLIAEPLPDDPSIVAFMDGAQVLVGLTDVSSTLVGDVGDASTILTPDPDFRWTWGSHHRTKNQERITNFVPLHEVVDQEYTMYFPVKSPS